MCEIIYDNIIIGGGISGLYVAYNMKNHKNLICESNDYFGGRIYTYEKTIEKKKYNWEAGAGRFTKNMPLLIKLLKILKLYKKIKPISSTSVYYNENDSKCNEISSENIHKLIKKIINFLKKQYTKKELQQYTLLKLIKRHFNPYYSTFIVNSYGYYSELGIMNAWDAIKLYKMMANEQFYVLQGGLSQIINKMVNHIKTYKNTELQKNCKITQINYSDKIYHIRDSKNNIYFCKNLILAIPKPSLKKISYINNIKNIDSIDCEPLMRIYCVYPKSNNGKVWFNDFGKITTNNKLKYIIPINPSLGIIMISYTDGKYTKSWKNLNNKGLHDKIGKELKKLFPDLDIPKPLFIKAHYWDCGCGYWKPGVNSDNISREMIQPFKNQNLFICGENYSTFQAWMEGALSTANYVLKKLN